MATEKQVKMIEKIAKSLEISEQELKEIVYQCTGDPKRTSPESMYNNEIQIFMAYAKKQGFADYNDNKEARNQLFYDWRHILWLQHYYNLKEKENIYDFAVSKKLPEPERGFKNYTLGEIENLNDEIKLEVMRLNKKHGDNEVVPF